MKALSLGTTHKGVRSRYNKILWAGLLASSLAFLLWVAFMFAGAVYYYDYRTHYEVASQEQCSAFKAVRHLYKIKHITIPESMRIEKDPTHKQDQDLLGYYRGTIERLNPLELLLVGQYIQAKMAWRVIAPTCSLFCVLILLQKEGQANNER